MNYIHQKFNKKKLSSIIKTQNLLEISIKLKSSGIKSKQF